MLPHTPLQAEVATCIEKGMGRLQCGTTERAGVINRCAPLEHPQVLGCIRIDLQQCAPLERRQVLSISVLPCNGVSLSSTVKYSDYLY